ncbi:PAS domain S-box protein [Mucilaginibacter sp. UYCu711]|uniref:PAS domain S-box protein n=1 Tax=Mucilaginibacter sp. UYCu711 TaxID=3156339 RepID=UPI003D1FD304
MINNIKNTSIQRKLMRVILVTCSVVLVLMCGAYLVFEYFSSKNTIKNNVSTLAVIIASNSSAALAFDSPADATEILDALNANKHIVAAALYNKNGKLFAKYPADIATNLLPSKPAANGYQFNASYLEGYQPVMQQSVTMGTLYIKSNLEVMYSQINHLLLIGLLLTLSSLVIAYLLSNILQKTISRPILDLEKVANMVSKDHDYSTRVLKTSNDEIGSLTDAFNQMLTQIEQQNLAIISSEEASSKLAAIVESSSDAIISKTPAGIITSWNKSAERILGYSAEEMIGQSILKIIPPDRQDEEPQIIQRLLSGERVENFDTLRLKKDNTLINISLSISPIRDTKGTIIGFSKIARDITEKKQEEMRKNDFIAIVSHELKTPLTSVKSYIQVLLAIAKKDEATFSLNALTRADIQIKKMTTLIQDFLNLARLEDGKMHLNKENFELHSFIEEIVNEVQFLAVNHTILFTDCKGIIINADKEKMGQVLNNLLSNAIKYSPKGGDINITCKTIDGKIRIAVTDQGVGINKRDQKKLFDRFYRVKNEKLKTVSGFGIGLYLVSEIVRYHNSKIEVESTEDQGSTFYFDLDIKSK